jgi:hypothetical protein
MEKILVKHIIYETRKLWANNNQFGFLPGCSSVDAVAQVDKDLYYALDNNLVVQAIFSDFAKAFDEVNHEILLNKLEKISNKNN